jgi:hypothetical protein
MKPNRSGIKKLRARCDTWAWRWTTLWRSQKDRGLKYLGRAAMLCPHLEEEKVCHDRKYVPKVQARRCCLELSASPPQ